MVSAEARAELERLFAERRPDRPLEQRRREWEAQARLHVLPKGARFSQVEADGIPSEWMEMPRVARDRALLLLHGGGYVAGSSKTHRRLAANLCRAMHMRVLTPNYRLAPENPFPAGAKDALRAYGWLLRQGLMPNQIVVGGDSAGGGLALSMLLALRDAAAVLPRAAVLLSPWTDLTVSSPSYRRHRALDPILSQQGLREAAAMYAGTRDPSDPLLSPLFADLRGLPPILIQAGGDEAMVDDSRRLAEGAQAAGVHVTCKIFEGMWHVFHASGTEIPEARLAIDEIGAYVRELFTE
jgi:monoterpene epsilon-lactone hydrolase